MAYGPLYRWLLTDMSIKKLLEKDEWAINRLMKNDDLPLLIKKRKIFEEVAKRKWISVEKIAINFLRSQKNVSYVLFGTTNKKHLDMLNFLI
jgi:aryl-alcohol dehydrogenase-like predicted oxidoreductase